MKINACDIWTQIVQGDIDDSDLVQLWNEYCSNNSDYDNYIYDFDEYEVNEILGETKPYDAMMLAFNGDIAPSDDYFTYGAYFTTFSSGNLYDHVYFSDLFKYGSDVWCENEDIVSEYCEQLADSVGIDEDECDEYDWRYFIDSEYDWNNIPSDVETIKEDWKRYKGEMNEINEYNNK